MGCNNLSKVLYRLGQSDQSDQMRWVSSVCTQVAKNPVSLSLSLHCFHFPVRADSCMLQAFA